MKAEIKKTVGASGEPEEGLRDLARFEAAYEKAAGRPFDWSSEGARLLARIFGNSRVLSDRLAANPSWAEAVARPPYCAKRKPAAVMREELARILPPADEGEPAFTGALCDFKYAEMTRIVMRDIASAAPVRELLSEWSEAAEAILDAAWRRAFETAAGRAGPPEIPSPRGGQKRCRGAVIALGKLGGRELNMSSDVDLMIVYESDEGGAVSNSGALTTNHEFYVRVASLFTRLVSTPGERGFALRVDHDLRPEGPQGPLANSVEAAERYYEYFGRDWERQALIRARPVAGDIGLGLEFVEAIRPFVFRRSVSIDELAHMRRMKREMGLEAERRGGAFDVKLGRGGIREAEFLTQALCLLFGGSIEAVRRGNTFEALEALAAESIIHPYGAQALTESYSFLRRLENMIQAHADRQTHAVPENERPLRALARRMGFDGEEPSSRLREELSKHRENVSRLFDALFGADYERIELMDAIRDNAARARGEEEETESLAWFRAQECKRIRRLDLTRGMPQRRVAERLTLAAEAVLACALEIASGRMRQRFGAPALEDGSPAGFAIVGLGSLGSRDMDYGSDLDLCFIYDGHGLAGGDRRISNVEYFTRLAQRVISMISMPGRYGRAYSVDSELRPSGRAGTLVTSLASFIDYHREHAQLWERQSLMKARAVAGDPWFLERVRLSIDELAFGMPPPAALDLRAEIAGLRERRLAERSLPGAGARDLKSGRGGLAELEAVVQMHQMLNAALVERLRTQNTMDALDVLKADRILPGELCEEISGNISFLRGVISSVRLFAGRCTDEFSPDSPHAGAVAERAGAPGALDLASHIDRLMMRSAQIFDEQVSPVRPEGPRGEPMPG